MTNNSSTFSLLFFSSPPSLFYLLLSFFQTNNYESVRIHGLVLLYIKLEVLNDQEQNRKHQTCTHVISQKWKKNSNTSLFTLKYHFDYIFIDLEKTLSSWGSRRHFLVNTHMWRRSWTLYKTRSKSQSALQYLSNINCSA